MSMTSVPDRTVGDISILQFPFAKYTRSVEPTTNATNRTVDTSPELAASIARDEDSTIRALSSASPNPKFATRIGGGIDIPINAHLAVRVVQIDYYLTTFANATNDHQNNLLIGAGIVYRWSHQK